MCVCQQCFVAISAVAKDILCWPTGQFNSNHIKKCFWSSAVSSSGKLSKKKNVNLFFHNQIYAQSNQLTEQMLGLTEGKNCVMNKTENLSFAYVFVFVS